MHELREPSATGRMNHTLSKIFHGIGRYWFLILIALWAVYYIYGESTKPTLPPPVPQNLPATSQPLDLSSYRDPAPAATPAVSLPTGTVIKSRSYYLSGDGELKIDNGTNSDAVAKLIAGGTSIFTVYIKAHSIYTIKDITNGTYWLVFALGSDWDASTKTFRRSAGFSSFDDPFDFTTWEDSQYVHYSSFQITLNPVLGGTAETSSVDAAQFNAY